MNGDGTSSAMRALSRFLAALTSRTGPARRDGRTGHKGTLLAGCALLLGAAGGAAIAGREPEAAAVPADERSRIEAVVRAYILANPEIIPEAMQRLQDKRAASSVDQHRSALVTPYAGAWKGAENADVILVEFFDYACGYCRVAKADIERLLAEDKGLKVVYRELPILSDDSEKAARVGLLAARAGRYSAYHDAVYAASGGLSVATIRAAAAIAGLDRAAVDAAIVADEPVDELTGNLALARALDARGTPLFVVGDQILNGAVGYDALKEAVAKTRAAKETVATAS